jgi:hypothetical protein
MSRIETLTPEQIARFDEFRDRWIRIGLCTEPANRPRAEAAIRDMYRQGGREPPAKIVWCSSPLSLCLTRAIVLNRSNLMQSIGASVLDRVGDRVGVRVWRSVKASVSASVWDSVEANVLDSIGDSVVDSVVANVLASVGDRVGDSVFASVGASLRSSVWDSVSARVGASVWDSVVASVWDSVGDRASVSVWAGVKAAGPDVGVRASVRASVCGAYGAASLAFYRYFHDAVGLVDQTAKLSGLWELAQSAGWALPHQNICWVSERHHVLLRDDRGRLHCESGPAVAYPDGWAIYAVHGVRVPRYVIEHPRQIDIARIDAVKNAEVRRVMIDRYRHGEEVSGSAAFMRDAGERLDHDERFGTLWRRNVPGDEPIVMIEVINSTREPDGRRKRYWLRVPPNMTTAHEAVAWSFNVPAKDYAPKVET